MEQLITAIVNGLVDDKESVSVTSEAGEGGITVYHIKVAPPDMGRVIGKQGRIAKAIRAVVRAAAAKNGDQVAVEID